MIFRDLSKNHLTVVEGLLFKDLVSLKSLILRQNNIKDLLDGSFYGLTNLQSLYVYNIIKIDIIYNLLNFFFFIKYIFF